MKLMRILVGLVLFVGLAGCNLQQAEMSDSLGVPITTPLVHKTRGGLPAAESTPFVWNGRLLVVTVGIEVYDYNTLQVVATDPLASANFGFISAIVSKGVLYVFGTDDITPSDSTPPGNSILVVTTSDLSTWTAPKVVDSAPTTAEYYNTSVCATPQGFLMTIETRPVGTDIGFEETFATSSDLVHWTPSAGLFLRADGYSSCPTIRYSAAEGYFYLLYSAHNANPQGWYVDIARSRDLVHWQINPLYVVLSPWDNTPYETGPNGQHAIDNSDIDLAEYNGSTYLVYDYGDQATWGHYGEAVFNGPEDALFSSFFR